MPTPTRIRHTDGKYVWRVKVRPGGRRGYTTSRTFGSERDANEFCRMVEAIGAVRALQLHDSEEARVTGPTLDDVVEEFFAWKLNGTRAVRSDRTVTEYRSAYRLWIQPMFGHRTIHTITEAEVQTWIDVMLSGTLVRVVRTSATATQRVQDWGPGEPVPSKALDPKTVRDRHSLLAQMFDWLLRPAQRDRYGIDHNPCRALDLPRRIKKPAKGLRPAEWQQLWPHLVDKSRDAAEFALFLLSTGWRFSAAAALSADDVEDYDDGGMWVTQNFTWRFNADGSVERVEDTKGSGSRGRRIRVDPLMAEVIRRRLDRTQGGLVFTTLHGGRWDPRNFIARYWNPVVDAAGLDRRPTPHWLRHSQANWMLLTGKASIAEVQRRMGHEQAETTVGVYGRLVEDVPTAALEAFAVMRGPVGTGLGVFPGDADLKVIAPVEDEGVADPIDGAPAGDVEV